jgi:hypothetical protein
MESSKIKLRTRDRDTLFKKEFSELKIKIALNWFEIVALLAISFFIFLKIISYFQIVNILFTIIIAVIASLIVTYIFCCVRKYKLNITRFDKEDIYKKISADLIDKKKCV